MQLYVYNNGNPIPAPASVTVDDITYPAPDITRYAAAGIPAKPLLRIPAPSTPREGYHYEQDGWRDSPAAITPRWKLVQNALPPPRRFSKLRVVAALAEAGVWPQVKAWIEAQGLYDLYLAAQDFSEDNEYFVSGRAALATALGWTDEQVEAILAQAVIGGAA